MHYDKDFINSIADILQRNKVLNNNDVAALKKEFAKRSDLAFEEFLIEENIISKRALLKALEEYYQVPFIDVIGVLFDHHLVKMFPKDVLMRYNFIPYRQDGNVLGVVAANPNDPILPEIIGKYVSYDVTFLVGYFRDINNEIEDFYDTSVIDMSTDQDLLPDERLPGSVASQKLQQRELKQLTEIDDLVGPIKTG